MNTITQRLTRKTINDRRFLGNTLIEIENTEETEKQPMKFAEFSNSLIDFRLGIFTAVRGCNSSQAAKLNQANIVNYIVECIVNGTQTKQLENKSFFGFYENHPEYGKVFRVRQK